MSGKLEYKKQYKDLYLPGAASAAIDVPPMRFLMIDGAGDPNAGGGAFQSAVGLLYALAYTIKMSPKSGNVPEGYFDYTVFPLEGLWRMADGSAGVDYARKDAFCWTAMIRQPEFVTPGVFEWACGQVRAKKRLDPAPARLETYSEGLCVQCMHTGPFDDEPATLERLEAYIREHGLQNDTGTARRHHEIYLSDPRKAGPASMKTVLRVPVKKR